MSNHGRGVFKRRMSAKLKKLGGWPTMKCPTCGNKSEAVDPIETAKLGYGWFVCHDDHWFYKYAENKWRPIPEGPK